jgi:hypothetical protein
MAGARTKAVFSGMALGKEEAMGGLPKVIATVNFKGGVGKTTASRTTSVRATRVLLSSEI